MVQRLRNALGLTYPIRSPLLNYRLVCSLSDSGDEDSDAPRLEEGGLREKITGTTLEGFSEDPFSPLDGIADDDGNILTFRAVAVGVVCGALVNASNIYLGLKSGWSISANLFAVRLYGCSYIRHLCMHVLTLALVRCRFRSIEIMSRIPAASPLFWRKVRAQREQHRADYSCSSRWYEQRLCLRVPSNVPTRTVGFSGGGLLEACDADCCWGFLRAFLRDAM